MKTVVSLLVLATLLNLAAPASYSLKALLQDFQVSKRIATIQTQTFLVTANMHVISYAIFLNKEFGRESGFGQDTEVGKDS